MELLLYHLRALDIMAIQFILVLKLREHLEEDIAKHTEGLHLNNYLCPIKSGMNIIDFLIGGLLANGLIHFVISLTKIRFLSLFGYSSKANLFYALLQFAIAVILLTINYNVDELLQNGILVGVISVIVAFLIFGKMFVRMYSE